MKLSLSVFAAYCAMVVMGCAKVAEPRKVETWTHYQEPYFKMHFAYPGGWHLVGEGSKISVFSSQDAMEKFYDPTTKGKLGIQLIVAMEKLETSMTLEQYVETFKGDRTSEGFMVGAITPTTIDGSPASRIEYSGRFDENTLLQVIRALTIQDSMLYYVQYGAFNDAFEPNRFLFDSLLTSVHIIKPESVAKVETGIPSETFVEFSNNLLRMTYPNNFEPTFPTPKSGVEFSLELKGYRQDCTIHIDILPAQGLSTEKVVEQNQKFYKSTSRGSVIIDDVKVTYLNYSPAKSIESRVYFMVKNDKVYRMIFNIFQPMKKDFLPAFEKTVASVRVK
jgi:hypothetical protein